MASSRSRLAQHCSNPSNALIRDHLCIAIWCTGSQQGSAAAPSNIYLFLVYSPPRFDVAYLSFLNWFVPRRCCRYTDWVFCCYLCWHTCCGSLSEAVFLRQNLCRALGFFCTINGCGFFVEFHDYGTIQSFICPIFSCFFPVFPHGCILSAVDPYLTMDFSSVPSVGVS